MEFRMATLSLSTAISPTLALACAPLLTGIIAKTKAFFAGRKGPPLLQAYSDILKLLRKGAVYSTTTSWVFRAGPVVSLGALLACCLLMPFGALGAVLSFSGDILLFVYLLAVARFFTVIAALDTGSPFEGMGASREVFFSALVEPVFLVCLLALSGPAQSFCFQDAIGKGAQFSLVPALLAGFALVVVMLAENARLPVDDPATHLELTMIHEVMVLDHGGPDFAFITYGASLKLWLFGLIAVRAFLPLHAASVWIDVLCTCAGMVVIGIVIGTIESVTARLRLLRVPQLLTGAAALALLALLAQQGALP
jgi:formate hydrogenlyase subunit 4